MKLPSSGVSSIQKVGGYFEVNINVHGGGQRLHVYVRSSFIVFTRLVEQLPV